MAAAHNNPGNDFRLARRLRRAMMILGALGLTPVVLPAWAQGYGAQMPTLEGMGANGATSKEQEKLKTEEAKTLYAPAPEGEDHRWRLVPSITIGQHYTDNALLDSTSPKSDWFTSLSPGVSLRGEGRRLKGNLDYYGQYFAFYDNPKLDRTIHILQSDFRVTILPEHFFLDIRAQKYPALVSGLGRITGFAQDASRQRNSLFGPGANNRADITSYGVTPRYEQRLGNFAKITASLTEADSTTGDSGKLGPTPQGVGTTLGAGRSVIWQGKIASGDDFRRLSWDLDYNRRRTFAASNHQNSLLQGLFADFGYHLTRQVTLNGSIGIEDNHLTIRRKQQHGPSGSVGFTYNPSINTELKASYGQRSFGSTKAFSFRHKANRFTISGEYNEELLTTAEALFNRQPFQQNDAFGNPIPVEPGRLNQRGLPLDNPGLTDGVLLMKRFQSRIGYTLYRNDFGLTVYQFDQQSTNTLNHETAVGMTGEWNRRLRHDVTAGVLVNYQNRKLDLQKADTDYYYLSPYISYQLGPHLSSRFSYSWMNSESTLKANNYTENSVLGSLTYAF